MEVTALLLAQGKSNGKPCAGHLERVTAHILIPAPGVTPTPLPTRTPIPMATATATLLVSSSLSLPAHPAPTATRAPILQSFQSPAVPIPQSSNLPSTAPNSSFSVPPSSFPLWGATAAAAIAAATGLALAAKRRRKDALRRACRDEEREQAERVRAAVEAKNAALEAARRAKMEALKIRNWLMGQAMVRNALSQSGLSEREQEQVRAEVRTRGVSAALGLLDSLKQAAQARLAALEARVTRMEERLDEAQQSSKSPTVPYPRRPLYPDPETADMTEAERLAEYKQSAAYQARQVRYRQWEGQQAYLRYRQGEWANPQPIAQPKPAGSSESKPWWQRAGEWIRQKVVQPVQQAVPKVMNWIDQHQKEIAIGVGIAAGVAAIVLSGGAATPLVAAAWVAGSAAVAGGVAALGTVGLNAYFHRPLGTNVLRNLGYAAGVAAVTATAGFALQAVAPTVTRAAAQFCLGHVTTCSVAAPAFKAVDYAWTGYDVWQSQRTLNNPRARAAEKLLAAVNIGLAAWSESLEPDDALAIGLPVDDVVRRELMAKFAEILEREGKDAAFDYLRRALGDEKAALVMAEAASHADEVEDALRLAGYMGDDIHSLITASRLRQVGVHSDEGARLVKALAEQSTRGSGSRVVIGKWVEGGGYVAEAQQHGGIYFETAEGVWDALGKDPELAWAVNEQFLRNQLEAGVSRIELVGETIEQVEKYAVGTFRWKEIQFLKEHAARYGYELVGNSWVKVR